MARKGGDNEIRHRQYIHLKVPARFRFSESLAYLSRSPDELLYEIDAQHVARMVKLGAADLWLQVSSRSQDSLDLVFETAGPVAVGDVVQFVTEWLDLDRDLRPFYRMALTDELLSPLVKRFDGLRLVRIPDLFEGLCWAIIGQQINLGFAYTLKRRFVQSLGESRRVGNKNYWIFPEASRVAVSSVPFLRALQFTEKKSEYILGIARDLVEGRFSKAALLQKSSDEALRTLTALRGVGPWTASYVAIRCLGDMTAYPVGDVGLQNAIKRQQGLQTKPGLQDLVMLGEGWRGWQAYATFYLWRSLHAD